ncbi:hypothetical protein [Streptomyces sp. Y1]|uniref:Uncharacterized protein n=1 Tax=Streptomyces sp. Y1 TaxID=3238634 RepID=A0AB39TW25_9ACTN
MSTPEEHGDPRVDERARERSAEQRNITAPTPADVRAEGEAEPDRGEEWGEDEEPPAGTRAP